MSDRQAPDAATRDRPLSGDYERETPKNAMRSTTEPGAERVGV
jgi:hypothetical protein